MLVSVQLGIWAAPERSANARQMLQLGCFDRARTSQAPTSRLTATSHRRTDSMGQLTRDDALALLYGTNDPQFLMAVYFQSRSLK